MTTTAERYPTLSKHGEAMLKFLSEHPSAPIYRNESGNRLTAEDIAALQQFDKHIQSTSVGWHPQSQPYWMTDFVAQLYRDVPFYRQQGLVPPIFHDLPSINRSHFSADISAFVPDSVPIERLINFRTTGTTGNPLLLASHPTVAARYLSFHKKALRRHGVELTHGRGQVGVVLVGYQQQCFTYVSVSPTMDESGLAKINLHPNDWHSTEDRARYLDALQPEIYTGDPLSFSELLSLDLTHQPKALISVGMMLNPAFKQKLEVKFACPVVDIYSLNEAGPVAVYDAELNGHLLLQPNLYVEILDPQGAPVKSGERGEITLTGGFNFCLPLLRYRTGDYASLQFTPAGPVLKNLEGRKAIRFKIGNGTWINNIDVTHALRPLPIAQFGLHQHSDHSFTLKLANSAMSLSQQIIATLTSLLGTNNIQLETINQLGKVVQYSSDLEQ